ncbi:hypothetical protein B0H21DRAFT_759044 [Amylocystis lapponica]|nr:hypothetical protein B0H21DRAFT_759044 [Amylocystis lapponica]
MPFLHTIPCSCHHNDSPALTLQGSPGHPPQIPAISTSNEIPASVSESTLCLAAISSYDLQNLLYLCKCAIKHHESSSGYSDIAKMLVPKHKAHNDAEVLYDNLDPASLMFDQLVPLDTSSRGTSTYSPRSGELPIELPRLSYMSPAGPYWREPHETGTSYPRRCCRTFSNADWQTNIGTLAGICQSHGECYHLLLSWEADLNVCTHLAHSYVLFQCSVQISSSQISSFRFSIRQSRCQVFRSVDNQLHIPS